MSQSRHGRVLKFCVWPPGAQLGSHNKIQRKIPWSFRQWSEWRGGECRWEEALWNTPEDFVLNKVFFPQERLFYHILTNGHFSEPFLGEGCGMSSTWEKGNMSLRTTLAVLSNLRSTMNTAWGRRFTKGVRSHYRATECFSFPMPYHHITKVLCNTDLLSRTSSPVMKKKSTQYKHTQRQKALSADRVGLKGRFRYGRDVGKIRLGI